MNRVVLMGRLTKDAEVRVNGETTVARFTLAVDRRFKKDETDFINCVAFGKTAEFFEKYGRKGSKFAVEGRIQTGSYTNKDGQKVYTTDVVIENTEFADSKNTQTPAENKAHDTAWMNIDEFAQDLPFN